MNSENNIIELISKQTGSDGKRGWPVCVRDRIAFAEQNESNVAVTFLWTIRDVVVPKLEKSNLAIAANFYTPAGLEGMVRNILGNPNIRYIIMLGNEYSSKTGQERSSELTSANAIRAFFEKGIDKDRRVPGFENALYLDRNIPKEMLEKVRQGVELIDLNRQMPDSPLEEKIAEANRLIRELPRKNPFMPEPVTFDYEKAVKSFPYEGGPLIVRAETIPKTWIEIMHNIHRYGHENLMDANTDRWVKEINNLVAVIHNPQNTELSVNPFPVPMTQEKIAAYQKEILSPELPEGKAYTYGNKLRAYIHSNPREIKELVNSGGYKDFEFGKGPHLDANVRYSEHGAEIDQVEDIIDALKRNLYSKSGIAITWHVHEELMRKHKSSPCLVMLQALVQDEMLNLTVFFRSHDMVQGWPENAYGCAAIQKKIADGIGVKPGLLTIISGSAQIYKHYYKQVEDMLEKFRRHEESHFDARGNFLVELRDGMIISRLLDPHTGSELERFDGRTAKEIYTKIAFRGGLNTEHAIYLGSELGKAETALRNNSRYEQDRELVVSSNISQKNSSAVPDSVKREIKEGIVQNRQEKRRYREILRQVRIDSFFV